MHKDRLFSNGLLFLEKGLSGLLPYVAMVQAADTYLILCSALDFFGIGLS